jgi:hypothetical protein
VVGLLLEQLAGCVCSFLQLVLCCFVLGSELAAVVVAFSVFWLFVASWCSQLVLRLCWQLFSVVYLVPLLTLVVNQSVSGFQLEHSVGCLS